MCTLISKILNYESTIFEEYCIKRELLRRSLEHRNNLTNEQKHILMNDIKTIIDPIKISLETIDYHLLQNTDLSKKDTIIHNDDLKYLLFYFFFLGRGEGFSSHDTLETDEVSSISVSDNESDSSK